MKKIRDNQGFTLIEVLIALAIVSTLTISFYKVLNSSIMKNAKNESDIRALSVAKSEVEEIINKVKNEEISKVQWKDDKSLNDYEVTSVKNEKTEYIFNVNMEIIREKKDEKYLYTIKTTVNEKGKKFSEKKTKLITQVSEV